LPQLGIQIPPVTLLRFWSMLAHYHGQIWNGAEFDLLLIKNGRRIGVECKRMDAPRLTPSMRTAISDLELSELFVVYPGKKAYPLLENVQVIPLETIVLRPEVFQ
jgi:hypothetical protein